MEPETWFYVIIAIISIVVSIIGKKQKKLQQQKQRQQQQDEYSKSASAEREPEQPSYNKGRTDINDFFEMFKEAVNEEEEVEDTEEEYEENTEPELIEKEEEPEVLDSPVSELDKVTEEGISLIESYSYDIDESKEIGDLKEQGFKLEEFDIKNAIIFSEILNRKQY
ncbi:hypothetical protein ACFLTE_01455 [Bacteroidota bacterium]